VASPVSSPPTLPELLDWIDTHINLEVVAGRIEGLSLQRMRALIEVLDEPQRNYPVIHITGTNGKGSTARLITALLVESGLTVGTYSSPHLERVNERITRNNEPISDEDLAEVLDDLRRLEPLTGVRNSWFELLTGAALRWFADVSVDVAVVEVGVLGRYDATNVVDAAVAVITNVGSDHTDFAGDWRARIAEEKAGIVKPDSILVLGETDPDLLPIFYRAGAAEVWERDRDFGVEDNELAVGGRLLALRTPSGVKEEVYLPLHGAHQGDNAAIALAAVEAFFAAPVDEEVVAAAWAKVTIPGRFEVVHHSPLVVVDGGHNREGVGAAMATLLDDFETEGEIIVAFGLLGPRSPVELLDSMEPSRIGLLVATAPDSPRAVPTAEVAAAAEQLGIKAMVEPDPSKALDRALRLAGDHDAVLVTGSLYLVGVARSQLLGGKRSSLGPSAAAGGDLEGGSW
jgi:dihydrofolate synthase / folylpolyglutamate synthase